MDLGFFYQLVVGLIMAGAVYGGIRSDIKAIHEGLKDAREAAKEAHQRIDNILMKG